MHEENLFVSQESCKNSEKKRIMPEMHEQKDEERTTRRKESGKNIRIQESCLERHFLPRQPRFGLHGSCHKVKICFSRRDSNVEGMAK